MRREVEQVFDAFVKRIYESKGSDIVRFFTKHERKNLCLDNLCAQIKGVERSRMSLRFDKQLYTIFIEDVAAKFCGDALRYAKEQALTRAEQERLRADAEFKS